jgi:hypothetical protein
MGGRLVEKSLPITPLVSAIKLARPVHSNSPRSSYGTIERAIAAIKSVRIAPAANELFSLARDVVCATANPRTTRLLITYAFSSEPT